jgi:hypothetical protein
MAESWLTPGEELLGSWPVYLGDARVSAAKLTGKLHVTNQGVHFKSELALAANAAAMIGNWWERHKALARTDEHLIIPFLEIAGVQAVKKSLFVKALALKMKSGEAIEFQFGAASPQKAAEAIAARI